MKRLIVLIFAGLMWSVSGVSGQADRFTPKAIEKRHQNCAQMFPMKAGDSFANHLYCSCELHEVFNRFDEKGHAIRYIGQAPDAFPVERDRSFLVVPDPIPGLRSEECALEVWILDRAGLREECALPKGSHRPLHQAFKFSHPEHEGGSYHFDYMIRDSEITRLFLKTFGIKFGTRGFAQLSTLSRRENNLETRKLVFDETTARVKRLKLDSFSIPEACREEARAFIQAEMARPTLQAQYDAATTRTDNELKALNQRYEGTHRFTRVDDAVKVEIWTGEIDEDGKKVYEHYLATEDEYRYFGDVDLYAHSNEMGEIHSQLNETLFKDQALDACAAANSASGVFGISKKISELLQFGVRMNACQNATRGDTELQALDAELKIKIQEIKNKLGL